MADAGTGPPALGAAPLAAVACTDCGTAFRAELVDVPGGDVMTVDGRPRCRWCLFAAVMAEARARQAAQLEAMWRA